MPLKYLETQAEQILFRDNFINDTYVEDNGGVITNAPTINNGAIFNGTTQYITYDPLYMPNDFTIRAVIHPELVESADDYIISQYEISGNKRMWGIYKDNNDLLRIRVSPDGSSSSTHSTGYTLVNEVTELGFVVDNAAKTWKLYVNGVFQNTVNVTYEFSNLMTPFAVATIGGAGLFTGTIYNVDIEAGQRTDDEMLDYFNNSTFTDVDPAKSLVYLPLRGSYENGAGNRVTKNYGSCAPECTWGDGTTSGTFPTQMLPNGAEFRSAHHIDTECAIDSSTMSFTAGCWCKSDAGDRRYAMSQAKSITPSYASDWIICVNEGALFWFRSTILGVTSDYSPYAWNHFIMVWDYVAGTYEGFVNGESIGTSGAVTTNAGVDTVKVGTRGDETSSFFNGDIRYPVVYPGKLTPLQVKELYNRTLRAINAGS